MQVIDVFGLDFGALLERPGAPIQGGELDTSLLLYLAPELVHMELARDFAVTPELLPRSARGTVGSSLGSPGRSDFRAWRPPRRGSSCIDLSSIGSGRASREGHRAVAPVSSSSISDPTSDAAAGEEPDPTRCAGAGTAMSPVSTV